MSLIPTNLTKLFSASSGKKRYGRRSKLRRSLQHEQLEERRVFTLPLTMTTAQGYTIAYNDPTADVVNDTLSFDAFVSPATDIDSYFFAPQFSGSYTIAVGDFGNAVDPEVAVYNANTGVRVGYNDDINFLNDDAQLTLNLVGGTRYIIAVADEPASNTGDVSIVITAPNNTSSTAIVLNTFGDGGSLVAINSNTDIDYFSFTAPADATGNLNISLTGASFIPRVALFDSSGDMVAGPAASISYSNVVPGEAYRLAVFSQNYATSGTANLNIDFSDITAVVTNTSDSGPGSLRQAMLDTNAHLNEGGVPDKIRFQIPGAGPHTIALTSALPTIGEAVVIDASTQPGTTDFPSVAIDGAALVGNIDGLRVFANGTTIRQLNIRNFPNDGVEVQANNVLLESLTVGSDWTVQVPAGNANYGIRLSGSDNTIFSCNVVASGRSGILISGEASDNNLIVSGAVGMALNGTSAIPNAGNGILIIDGDFNRILQTYINGNGLSGIVITGSATGTDVVGNFIGVNLPGTGAIPNAGDGILIQSSGNKIGGSVVGEHNVISGNGKSGITISGIAASNNRIEGNRIGTNLDGTLAIPNAGNGIRVLNAPNNRIGSPTDATGGNLISANGSSGITFSQLGASGGQVYGNKIGTDLAGLVALGNAGHGILINAGATDIQIGGTSDRERNIISANGASGVTVAINSSSNRIVGNFIGANVSATAPLGNGSAGVNLQGSENQVGGPNSGFGNIIIGNANGVSLSGAGAVLNSIFENTIGTNQFGNLGRGVQFLSGASRNTLLGNIITSNDSGVRVSDGSTRNKITRNAIFQNVKTAIDLFPGAGQNPQDAGDADVGGNNLQNSPTIDGSPLKIGDNLEINYSVNSLPANAAYPLTIEFYVSDGDGEPQGFISDTIYTAADFAAGPKNIVFIGVASGMLVGSTKIVALATDANGNTSEVSAERVLAAPTAAASMRLGIQQNGNKLDVNDDGVLSPLDALNIISALKRRTVTTMSEGELFWSNSAKYYDTNGDGKLTALDALLVIDGLRRPIVSTAVPDEEKDEKDVWDEAVEELSLAGVLAELVDLEMAKTER